MGQDRGAVGGRAAGLGAVLILLSGLPGVGKTALARAFCDGGRAVHLRVDTIEAAVTASSLPHDREDPDGLGDVGYRVAAAQAAEFSAGGHIVLGDAVNAVPEARRAWGRAALVVEVVCSDRERHRDRVEARRRTTQGASDWARVTQRTWVPWDRAVLRLDSAADAPEALAERLRAALPPRGVR